MSNSRNYLRWPRHRVAMTGLVMILLFFASAAEASQTRVVWSGVGEQGHLDLFEATLMPGGKAWSKPERLVANTAENITPAISEGMDGTVVVVWIAREANGQALLHYLLRFASGKRLQGRIDTGYTHNYSPTVLIDHRNTPWVAWASDDGTDEDIYLSRFEGRAWTPALRVNLDDDKPDIKPLLIQQPPDAVQVVWSGFDVNGYRPYQVTWQGAGFGTERIAKNDPSREENNKQACSTLPPLPAAAAKRLMAAVFIQKNKGLQSVPEWIAPCTPKPSP